MTEKYLTANGLRLAYDEFGDQSNPAILLIMGLATQMVAWPVPFCENLAENGFRVIRYDNRDIGLSEKMSHLRAPNPIMLSLLAKLKLPFKPPYRLGDMADDAIGVMDALGIRQAHIVGASMGGMIGQLLAAKAADRVLSFTSIMSSSGRSHIPGTKREILKHMIRRPENTEEEAIQGRIKMFRMIGSQGELKLSDDELREKVLRSYRRNIYPPGYARHLAAIAHSGSREKHLRQISCPTLVVHGKADPLIPVEGGIDTARLIPHSELQLIEDMGHDLPTKLMPRLAEMIAAHATQGPQA